MILIFNSHSTVFQGFCFSIQKYELKIIIFHEFIMQLKGTEQYTTLLVFESFIVQRFIFEFIFVMLYNVDNIRNQEVDMELFSNNYQVVYVFYNDFEQRPINFFRKQNYMDIFYSIYMKLKFNYSSHNQTNKKDNY